jgi:hypothetical protein
MAGSSRNSKATSSRSSKRSERLSSPFPSPVLAPDHTLIRRGNDGGIRYGVRSSLHHQALKRRTSSKPAGKLDWRIHRVQEGPHDDQNQRGDRVDPILCMKNGKIGRHAAGLFVLWKKTSAQSTGRKQTRLASKRPRVADGPPMVANLPASAERCLSTIAH